MITASRPDSKASHCNVTSLVLSKYLRRVLLWSATSPGLVQLCEHHPNAIPHLYQAGVLMVLSHQKAVEEIFQGRWSFQAVFATTVYGQGRASAKLLSLCLDQASSHLEITSGQCTALLAFLTATSLDWVWCSSRDNAQGGQLSCYNDPELHFHRYDLHSRRVYHLLCLRYHCDSWDFHEFDADTLRGRSLHQMEGGASESDRRACCRLWDTMNPCLVWPARIRHFLVSKTEKTFALLSHVVTSSIVGSG